MSSQKVYGVVGVTATETGTSAPTHIIGDFATSIKVANFSGLTSIICVLEESPDPSKVTDANATWYTLATFATITEASAKTEKILIIDPHFSRLRVVNTIVGTGSADVDVVVEGVEV